MREQVAISLLHWLRTGFFGPLRFGQTRATITLLLGSPDDVGGISRKYPRPSIWKYGDFELHFPPGADTLSAIQTDTFGILHGGPSIRLDPWQLRCGVSQQAIEAALASAGIACRRAASTHLPDTTQLITSAGVWLNFETEAANAGEMGSLCAMGQSARTIDT